MALNVRGYDVATGSYLTADCRPEHSADHTAHTGTGWKKAAMTSKVILNLGAAQLLARALCSFDRT